MNNNSIWNYINSKRVHFSMEVVFNLNSDENLFNYRLQSKIFIPKNKNQSEDLSKLQRERLLSPQPTSHRPKPILRNRFERLYGISKLKLKPKQELKKLNLTNIPIENRKIKLSTKIKAVPKKGVIKLKRKESEDGFKKGGDIGIGKMKEFMLHTGRDRLIRPGMVLRLKKRTNK